jgi:hypothetical protein
MRTSDWLVFILATTALSFSVSLEMNLIPMASFDFSNASVIDACKSSGIIAVVVEPIWIIAYLIT